MLVAVVSDTHGDSYAINSVLKSIAKADVLIHLGDNVRDAKEMASKFKGKTIYVRGNCDYSPTVKAELVENIGNKTFFITHGHNFAVKQTRLYLKERAKMEDANIALYGHTHIASIDYEEGIWYINPGSAGDARDGADSFAMIEITEGKINPWLVVVRR